MTASRARCVRLGCLIAALIAAVACAAPPAERTQTSARESEASAKLFAATPESFDRVIRSSEGLPTVVNAWASWCVPCRAEMPRFVNAAKTYADNVRFLGLNTQDDDAAALEFIEEFDVPFRSGTDPTGKVARHLELLGLPATMFYRPDGELAFLHNGEIQADDLTTKIEDLIRTSRRPK